jgi:FtsP/CotA-like multicopper oxidase with cupredoxin domain/fibronectin type 3 domain-containing protein
MKARKVLNMLVSLMVLTTLVFGGSIKAAAAPTAVDETKVPHYFGPNPNWANSPFTLPDAVVTITGNGTGATAEATVGANGAITAINITNPGHNYSNAKVDITGSGTGAAASATIVKKGAVVSVTVNSPGTGYTAPVVTFSGNGGAAATAYGGVDQVTVISGGSGYIFPTVEFDLPDDPNGVRAEGYADIDANGTVTAVHVTTAGSGYLNAPGVAIHNGTLADPIAGATLAVASSSLSITSIALDAFGADYNKAPDVIITDPTGSGATATAVLDNGIISAISLTKPGSGYLIPGIRKFVDTLPGLGPTGANNLQQYIPVGVPDQVTFPGADYYEIAVVEYQEQMHSDLPPTTLRGYVQLETSVITGSHYALPGGKLGVDRPHYLGPTIVAQKDRPVRITFYNLLATGAEGDLFLPVDTTLMGSGEANMDMPFDPMPNTGGSVTDMVRNPMCTEKYFDPAMRDMCFSENRATLHLHGGNSPWISDGTPHQWITPANETTTWPEGVSVQSVPDMVGVPGVPDCSAANDGCMTFYYTNQQSARLMFYHDHAWGITRLNVYAGEAAGYLIQDQTEQALIANGTIPTDMIPLVIQDRTFVPDDKQLYNVDINGKLPWESGYDPTNIASYGQDPTWDATRWGTKGNFWYHHVYMPAQNPGDPSGMSAYGRWMYGPWFWPPAGDVKNGPIANPYYNPSCNLDDPTTWQYQTDPFCEPQLIPGTPNISVGMEQFNDTPIVNGTAYPTVTLQPKSYRLRMLNAANDRFFNFQWYVADSTTASTGLNGLGQVIGGTEVAFKAAELEAAQTDPNVFPTPDLTLSPAGPDWVQIGTESGFLPAPVVVDGQQPTTWITDPTRFDVGNVDKHSLLLAPAERADVIVDFSKFAGKTLILYNDAPAAFPARVPSYDYYTGAPDMSPNGAAAILPGYGPNTRTVMQVKIAGTAAPAFNMTRLNAAFRHNANGTGVFESGQDPIIVGQAGYNSAYGTSFAASGWCSSPNSTNKCDGYARINQQGGDGFTFDTLKGAISGTWSKISIPFQPKAIHDEMNSTNFDEFGRMQATLGTEVVPATPGLQNVVLSPYVFPTTELIDTTNLPKATTYDANLNEFVDVKVAPIATADDGTQIWKITHNGVDTHPIHFHATDVQVINRVTWDNIIIPPDPTELGWKETVRVSPLEDTIVAMRPVTPMLPFDFPNSVRLLSPMMADGMTIDLSSMKDANGLGMTAFAPSGDPIDVYNHYVNYGAEYVYHCHILSHEEMDMMHAVLYAYPPMAPSNLQFTDNGNGTGTLTWTDNSLSETAFVVEKSADGGANWSEVGSVPRLFSNPLRAVLLNPMPAPKGDVLTFPVTGHAATDQYRVFAQNTIGDTWDYADPNLNEIVNGGFPTITTKSAYATVTQALPPAAPSNLTATLDTAVAQVNLSWTDNATDETGFVVERSDNGGAFSVIASLPGVDIVSYSDMSVAFGNTYEYQVAATNGVGQSGYSNIAQVDWTGNPPAAPTALAANILSATQVSLDWTDNAVNETGFVVERCTGVGCTNFTQIDTLPTDTVSYIDATVAAPNDYTYQVAAINGAGPSGYSNPASVSVTVPPAPTNLSATSITRTGFTLNWLYNFTQPDGFEVQVSTNSSFTALVQTFPDVAADSTSLVISGLARNTRYYIRIRGFNAVGVGAWSTTLQVRTAK